MKRPFPFGTAPRPLAPVRVDRTTEPHAAVPARAADLARMTEPIREGWRPPAQVLPFRPPALLPPPPPAPSRSRTAMAAASLMLALLMIALVIAFAQAARPPPPAHAATAPSVPTVSEPPASADTVSSVASAATAPAPRAPGPPRRRPWDGRRIVNPWE